MLQVVFTLVLMFYINFKLALASFIIVPAIVTISKVFSDYMRALSTETQDTLADANSTAEEVLSPSTLTLILSLPRTPPYSPASPPMPPRLPSPGHLFDLDDACLLC